MVCPGDGYLYHYKRIVPLIISRDNKNPVFILISSIQKPSSMSFIDWIKQPWPWYVAGPLIGLMVPFLLLIGNKTFGISSSLRHICAICLPAHIPFFKYDWKKEIWNLFFVTGIVLGAFLLTWFFANPDPIVLNPKLSADLQSHGVTDFQGMVPAQLFNWNALLTVKGIVLMVAGGFMVGFGTRYAGGCTSGHSIMGLSNMQLSSLIATISFMTGGFLVANLLIPFLLKL